MKKSRLLLAIPILAILSLHFTACDKEAYCEGRGTLNVENKSLHTVQRILIDGTNYGSLDPGESKDIELAAGKYTLQFVGINSGGGCTPSQVTIDACGEEGRSCSN